MTFCRVVPIAHFHQSGVLDLTGQGQDLRSLAPVGAFGAEPDERALSDDPGDIGPGFHIVQR